MAEERYFNEEGKACVRTSIYRANGNLQTATSERLETSVSKVKWKIYHKQLGNTLKTTTQIF